MNITVKGYIKNTVGKYGEFLKCSMDADELINTINKYSKTGKNGKRYFNFDIKPSQKPTDYSTHYAQIWVPDNVQNQQPTTDNTAVVDQAFNKPTDSVDPDELPF